MVNYYTTIQSILNYTRMFFDILIMWLLLYYTIKIVRNNSRTIQIFKGIVLILVIKAVANIFGLNTVGWIADMFVSWGFIAVIIIFQPEIRSLLEKLGDPRALETLEKMLKLTDLNYLDYMEIRNAVESLGGDPGEERTFYGDPDYEAMRNL